MRGAMICAWLVIPFAAAGYHYGPGQRHLQVDDAALEIREADTQSHEKNWAQAVSSYDAALALLPSDEVIASQRIRLERSKAQMLASQLPEAHNDLEALLDELSRDKSASPKLVDDVRNSLASAQYYVTWLMRLEGRPREDWEPEIESARQNYRLLAENAQARSDEPAQALHREDLEAAIRLARLDLADLQALPIPSQCKCCNSGKCRGNCKGTTNQPKEGERDARGGSSGPPPDNRGS